MPDKGWIKMRQVIRRVKELEAREREMEKQLKALQERIEMNGSGADRYPLETFLDYAEHCYTADQNDRAKVVKEMLGDIFVNISEENRKRLRMLGTKEKPMAKSIFDVSGNNHVSIGH